MAAFDQEPDHDDHDDDDAPFTAADYAQLPDMYTPASMVYQTLQIALKHFLSRPHDPLPQAVRTSEEFYFDEDGAERAMAFDDGPGLARLMREHFGDYYHLLLLGRLLLDSPLGPRLVPTADPKAPSPVAAALPYLRHITDSLLEGGENFMAGSQFATDSDDPDEVGDWIVDYRQRLTALFARLQHTLGSALPLAPPLVAPVLWGHYPLSGLEVQGLAAMLLTFQTLPRLSDQPLAQAVLELPGYHPQRLEKLQAKLTELRAPLHGGRIKTRFTEWQMLALYQAARLVAYTMVSGEGYNEGGLDDFMMHNPHLKKHSHHPPEDYKQMREINCALAEGFARLIEHTMSEHPTFLEVRAQVNALLDR